MGIKFFISMCMIICVVLCFIVYEGAQLDKRAKQNAMNYSGDFNKSKYKILLSGVEEQRISTDGVLLDLIADNIIIYEDVYYAKDVYGISYMNGYKEKLVTPLVKYSDKDRSLYFPDSVTYTKDDNITIQTKKAKFDIEKDEISSNSGFIFAEKNSRTIGRSFVYDINTGSLKATNIQAGISGIGDL